MGRATIPLTEERKIALKKRRSELHHQYYIANADAIRERRKTWKSNTLEYRRAKKKERRLLLGKPTRVPRPFRTTKEISAEQYRRHIVKIKTYKKAYRIRNRDKLRQYNRRRKALLLGATVGDINVISEWERRWRSKQRARCYWCQKKKPSRQCHTDHICPLSKGGTHSVENLCISCASCNLSKSDLHLEHWNAQIQQPVLILS